MSTPNPLRAAPSPLTVAAVTRFGLPGLIASALCAALVRRFNRRPPPIRVMDEDAGAFGCLYWECRHGHAHFFKLRALWCGLWASKGTEDPRLGGQS